MTHDLTVWLALIAFHFFKYLAVARSNCLAKKICQSLSWQCFNNIVPQTSTASDIFLGSLIFLALNLAKIDMVDITLVMHQIGSDYLNYFIEIDWLAHCW